MLLIISIIVRVLVYVCNLPGLNQENGKIYGQWRNKQATLRHCIWDWSLSLSLSVSVYKQKTFKF